jgi:hypothetical protein
MRQDGQGPAGGRHGAGLPPGGPGQAPPQSLNPGDWRRRANLYLEGRRRDGGFWSRPPGGRSRVQGPAPGPPGRPRGRRGPPPEASPSTAPGLRAPSGRSFCPGRRAPDAGRVFHSPGREPGRARTTTSLRNAWPRTACGAARRLTPESRRDVSIHHGGCHDVK